MFKVKNTPEWRKWLLFNVVIPSDMALIYSFLIFESGVTLF